MRIVYSTDNYHPRVSGMATSIDRFAKYLRKRGHEVHIFAPWYPGKYEDPPDVRRFRSIGLFFTQEDRLVRPWARGEVNRALDEIRPDIIHVQTEFEMGASTKRYALKNGIPLAMTAHTHWEFYAYHYFPWVPEGLARKVARWKMRDFFEEADLMICPTPPMKDVLLGYGLKKEIHVVPTGIDSDEFEGADRKAEREGSPLFGSWPELRGKKVMVYLGRVGLEKNIDFLLPVLKEVVESVPEAHLLVTGGGPYLDEMKAEARKMGLAARTTFTGYVERPLVKNVLTLADVFVFPSLTETQGLVTGEAMMCGTPVVAIGEMGTRYVMGGDNGGFMVENDRAEFVEAVLRLLGDPELWLSKSEEARSHAAGWDMRSLAARMESLYRSIEIGSR